MQLHSPFPPLPSGMKVSSINADTINVNSNSSRNLSGTSAFPSPELLQFQHTLSGYISLGDSRELE